MRNEKQLIIDGMAVLKLNVMHNHIDELMAEVLNDKVRHKKLCDIRKAIHLLEVFADAVSERGLPFDWISVKDELPSEGKNSPKEVLVISAERKVHLILTKCVIKYPEDFLYWYPIPPSPWKSDERFVQEKK